MGAHARVRLVSDLGIGDTVETPSGRRAVVASLYGGVTVTYCDEGDEVTLQPHLLKLLAKAQPHALPKDFFGKRVVPE